MPNDEEWPDYADPVSGYVMDPAAAKGHGILCARCQQDAFRWPSGTVVVQLYSYIDEPAPPAYICAKCYPAFGEALYPSVVDDPLWTQSCDQLFAFVRDNPDGDPRYP